MGIGNGTPTRVATLFGVILALGLSAPTFAQEETEGEQAALEQDEAAAEEEEDPNTGRVSIALQNDFTNVYFFRGLMQERADLIWQPSLELRLNLFESEDFPIRSFSLGAGVWNSVHDDNTLAVQSPRSLYETDWYPLVEVGLPHDFTFTTIYYYYTSPNGAFSTVHELNLELAWDDSEALGRWALQPWVNLAIETKRTSFGDREGEGIQLGIEPTLYEFEDERWPLSFTFPVELGLAIDDYYEEIREPVDPDGLPDRSEDTFGYVSFGLVASLPITCLPKDFGEWTLSVGGKGYYLSDALERVNRGDAWYPQVIGSLSLEY